MCGIVGVVNSEGEAVDRGLLEAMNARIIHRGPDEDGFWLGDAAGLAMRRLSIIDLAGGTQPFFSEDKQIVTVYNGEIYNFRQLREDLRRRGHTIVSNCDTEVIPHLYEEYGPDLMRHLVGMFAIAVWDRKTQSLLLARDRLGIKPLYYAVRDGRLYFASELKSFAPCGILGDLCPEAVYHYLTYGYIPAPLTIYEGIYKLPAGHRMVVRRGRTDLSRYWDVTYRQGPPRPEEELLDELHARLQEAVRIRLVSDVPLGAFLSGGVDSSLVVALMCETGAERVKTFSIAFDEPSHDESTYARAVASRFGTDHHEFIVRSDLWRHVEDIVLQFDEPFADSSAIPTYFLSKLTRQHVTVAMSGDGGDELFAGYDRYLDFFRKRPLYRIPRRVRALTFGLLADVLPRGTRGRRFLQSLRLGPLEDYARRPGELSHEELLAPDFLASMPGTDPMHLAREFLDRNVPCELDAICLHDLMLYLPEDILTKVDRTSMAVSLEVRVPILDHRVVEFAATLPPEQRLRGRTGKYLLKRLLERYMPREHVHRPKRGFAVPLGAWFRKELRWELMDVLGPSQIRATGVFRPDAVDFLVRQHMSGRRDHSGLLWRLFVLHLWDRRRQGAGRNERLSRNAGAIPVTCKGGRA